MRVTGTYLKVGNIEHFIPDPLPPQNPPLQLTQEITMLYGEASFQLGQLNALAAQLPDPTALYKSVCY